MQLFVIRHGQSENNALADVSQRVADPELTEHGKRQAEIVAAHLSRDGHLPVPDRDGDRPPLDVLYCSPMIRTLQTAQPIASSLSLDPDVWIDIHEVGGIFLEDADGVATGYPGCSRAHLQAEFPGYGSEAVGEDGWWTGEKETPEQGRGRAMAVASALLARAGEEIRIGLVSHGDFISALIKALANHLPSWGLYYHHHNTAITSVDFRSGDDIVFNYLNRAHHLPDDLVTN